MKKWEYTILVDSDEGLTEDDLNRMGDEGWEVVSVEWLRYRILNALFKREKKE